MPLPLGANEITQRRRMFRKEKQKNQGREWLREEERKEVREGPKYCFSFFFLITVFINEGYFRFLHLLMSFLWRFTFAYFCLD